MRALYYMTAETGTIFWDEKKTIVAAIHENDADFRAEYFTPLFEHYGITVEEITVRPKWLTKKILRDRGLSE